jgi:mono/diheme cytochrome c family protein
MRWRVWGFWEARRIWRISRCWAPVCCVAILSLIGTSKSEDAPPSLAETEGGKLFRQHCGACHGDNGNGQGLAAVFLYPKPRNLRLGPYKLVSAANNVPLRDDLLAVLERGMPGSSMPSWAHLTDTQRQLLVDEVLRMRAEGAREAYVAILRSEEELTDEALADPEVQSEIEEYVATHTVPGEPSVIPQFGPAAVDHIGRGKDVYAKFGCISCHGETGKGDGVQKMFDDDKYPTSPRDFTFGIFKGGDDPASLYRRIAYGMPGTPMPSSSAMTEAQMVDLVHYIRSLSTDEQRQQSVLRRQSLRASYVKRLSESVDDPVWNNVPQVQVPTTPLWWRNGADPGLKVQAAHDGDVIVIRLTWVDKTHNEQAVQADEFEDMAAVEWSPVGNEPFLGMGGPEMPVDLWHWRAGVLRSAERDQLMDDYPFDSPEYIRLQKGGEKPDFVTARAAKNPLTLAPGPVTARVAKGPGSTTFRPPVARDVQGNAVWRDGIWRVVFRRPMRVSADDGMPLKRGESYAVAFAIWDGAAHDRASQKVISIWNDLRIE